MTTYLLDANVLIALTVAEHEHHVRASGWVAPVERFALCPVVEGALIRFLVRLGDDARSAQGVLRRVRGLPRCDFWADSVSHVEANLDDVRGHRQITDSYLVALARARGAVLATLDAPLAGRAPEQTLLLPP